ncbi:MAG: Mur ligase family protein [Actinomycetes bacterium]
MREPTVTPRPSVRERAAMALADAASLASRALGKGKGEIIGGRYALRVAPSLLETMGSGRASVLVTGTNGKSTVTALVTAALATAGRVASNRTGANMPDGIVTSLKEDRSSELAAIEVDEAYLQPVVAAMHPRALIALNLSREYTRGVSLPQTVEHWQSAARLLTPETAVIVNTDDPWVQYAFERAPNIVPVAGGLNWKADSAICPACQAVMSGLGEQWSCTGCGRERIKPAWSATDGEHLSDVLQEVVVSGPDHHLTVRTSVPGRTAAASVAFALAAADAVGVSVDHAAAAVESVLDVDGRYAPFEIDGRRARIIMLKNPAGWTEAIDTAIRTDLPVVIYAEPFGPRDTTTIWEVEWERLSGRPVVVSGKRGPDVVACLDSHGVSSTLVDDPLDAVRMHSPGPVLVACNYSGFRQLTARLRNDGAIL